jgi:hypothetical protein
MQSLSSGICTNTWSAQLNLQRDGKNKKKQLSKQELM